MADTIKEPVLINQEYLKAYSLLPQNYDLTEVSNFIPIAERIHIFPILGEALFDELLTQVSENSLTEVNSTLLLKLYRIEGIAVVLEALPFIWTHFSKTGLTLGKSDNSDSISNKDITYIETRLTAQLESEKRYVKQWLDDHSEAYPLYTKPCVCEIPKVERTLYSLPKVNTNIN